MWKSVNKILNKDKTRTFPSSVTYKGQNLENPREISEAFNDHFLTIGPKLASEIQSETTDDPLQYLSAEIPFDTPPFVFQRIDENLVKREINRLKCSKSPGHDQIPVKVIKDAVEIVSKPLAKIFNSSMEEGIFPDIWKLAMVTPIFKTGQKSDFCNYRPIAVLSVLSKLFEKIVHDQVSTFMKDHGHFSHCQHGFRQLHSTVTSLLNVTELWFSNIDRKKVNMSVLLDLKKAFDTVDHDLLLAKLAAYGIVGGPHQWFSSYLTRREQYCQIGGQRSSRKVVKHGIPQGSCLGPLLFILYVDDFAKCLVKSSPNMYADDTSVTCSAKDIDTLCDDLRTELTNISKWMRQNKLSLNANKSEFLIVGHKRQLNGIHEPVQLQVDEEPIRRVQTVKYLGIRVDENLSWNEQYKSLKCKVEC